MKYPAANKWKFKFTKIFLAILFLVPISLNHAYSSDWIGNIDGKYIHCSVENIETYLGIWTGFDVIYSDNGVTSTIFYCSGKFSFDARSCGMKHQSANSAIYPGNNSFEFDLIMGTREARMFICGQVADRAGFRLR